MAGVGCALALITFGVGGCMTSSNRGEVVSERMTPERQAFFYPVGNNTERLTVRNSDAMRKLAYVLRSDGKMGRAYNIEMPTNIVLVESVVTSVVMPSSNSFPGHSVVETKAELLVFGNNVPKHNGCSFIDFLYRHDESSVEPGVMPCQIGERRTLVFTREGDFVQFWPAIPDDMLSRFDCCGPN